AKDVVTKKGLQPTIVGSGNEIVDVSAEKGSQLLQNDRIILLTDKPAMPDTIGWSQRDILQLADLLQLKIEVIGDGYVVKQSIKKDKPVKKGDYLGVELAAPSTDNKKDDDEETEENNEQEESSETEE